VRRQGEGAVCVAALVLLLAVACGGPTATTHRVQPSPSPAASAAPLSDWQRLGATEAPPASLQQVSLGGAEVVNQSAGAVSDGDARAWAEAFMRTFGYLLWAVSRGQDGFLMRSGLSSAPLTVFEPNVNDIVEARRAGDRVEYTRETFRRLVVRAVPQSLQPSFQRAQYVWKPYAIYLDAVGPITTTWVDAQGNRTVKSRIDAGVPAFELVGGELSHVSVMGDVWVLASDFDCTAPSSRQTLAPLCNP
jgi:hypothetical protein